MRQEQGERKSLLANGVNLLVGEIKDTIHGTPKRSSNIPKAAAQKVGVSGILTVPPSDNAWNNRAASAGSAGWMAMWKPCGRA